MYRQIAARFVRWQSLPIDKRGELTTAAYGVYAVVADSVLLAGPTIA